MLSFKLTDYIRSSTYDRSRYSIVLLKLHVTSSHRSEMSLSTVSKATFKSSSDNSEILPLSIASIISENTFNTALSNVVRMPTEHLKTSEIRGISR